MSMETVIDRLRNSPAVGSGLNPYYNVAGCAYVRIEHLNEAIKHIAALERQVAAYDRYLNGGRRSASGIPLTKV